MKQTNKKPPEYGTVGKLEMLNKENERIITEDKALIKSSFFTVAWKCGLHPGTYVLHWPCWNAQVRFMFSEVYSITHSRDKVAGWNWLSLYVGSSLLLHSNQTGNCFTGNVSYNVESEIISNIFILTSSIEIYHTFNGKRLNSNLYWCTQTYLAWRANLENRVMEFGRTFDHPE